MCGRYSLFTPPEELEDRFDAAFGERFDPRYNATPGQTLPVVTDDAPTSFSHLRWGLIPRWADDGSDGHINARAETVAEKPTFADAYAKRRCLVPADGFYEWARTDDGTQPYRVALEDDEPFAMAGLWEQWIPDTLQTGLGDFADDGPSGDADPVETFTIITTEPNDVVEPLHGRMAVILSPDEEDRWLDGEDVPLDPYDPDPMRAYPVSTAVNDPSNDSPALIEVL